METLIPGLLIRCKGKYFMSRDLSLDEEPCQNCHQIKEEDIPLRLFNENGRGYCFCVECAESLGIFDNLKTSDRR